MSKSQLQGQAMLEVLIIAAALSLILFIPVNAAQESLIIVIPRVLHEWQQAMLWYWSNRTLQPWSVG
ncbi:hypothetical protein [Pseudidiomarina taiwanensis]|uniref:Uncharacterized protein n=1 Tax=Pseudidiomarina taiwanensis TaxID=337250 RepID=A0A432ZC86_9GAMM|nr:hypothetical protein [Pseudidiomarina taiwanensis]RUO75531.1 hypothetical protein CWI83_10395 [Pseudidiomarina taiwanensis]